MNAIKGFAAGFVALVACPCHLSLTMPAVLLLTSGTALGVWLAANHWFFWAASTALFMGGLAFAFLWLGRSTTDERCDVKPNRGAQLPESEGLSTDNGQTEIDGQHKEVIHV